MEKVGFLEEDHIGKDWITGESIPTVRVVGDNPEKGGRDGWE
jgi:hypothetical protein